MSATKAKPAGRAVRREPKVRVRKMWHDAEQRLMEDIFHVDRENGIILGFSKNTTPSCDGAGGRNVQPCLFVTGYTGSAKKLKRLAEIAGMDEEEIFRRISNANGLIGFASIDAANRIMEALGLSTAQGRKGKKP